MAEETASAKLQIGIYLQGSTLSDLPGAFKAFLLKHRGAGNALKLWVKDEEAKSQLGSGGFLKASNAGGSGLTSEQVAAFDGSASLSGFACTHFISDDASVFTTEGAASAQPLLLADSTHDLYPTFTDWQSLGTFFDWAEGWSNVSQNALKALKVLKDHGENTVYKLTASDDSAFLLKRYHGIDQRMENEFKNLTLLQEVGITNVPKPLWAGNNCAFYSFIDGKQLEVNSSEDMQPVIDMLEQLDGKQKDLRAKGLPKAPGARTNLRSYVSEVNKKFNAVQSAAQTSSHGSDTMMFMFTDMEQMRQDNINHFYLWCKRQKWDLDEELPEKFFIASSGDFGLHNTLQSGETVHFVDWEGSGFDDPAKLMADFFHNDEQELSIQDKLQVLNAFVQSRESWDKEFLNRFYAISDLVAVEWVLKRMMPVIPEEMARLKAKNPGLDEKTVIDERLAEAQKAHKEFQPMEHVCKHDQLLEGSGEYEGDIKPTEE
jgi:thiamine kinase-like enzyme